MYDMKIRNIRQSTMWNLMWLSNYLHKKIPVVDNRIAAMYKEDIYIIKRVLQMEPVTDKEYNRITNRFRKIKMDEETYAKHRSQ